MPICLRLSTGFDVGVGVNGRRVCEVGGGPKPRSCATSIVDVAGVGAVVGWCGAVVGGRDIASRHGALCTLHSALALCSREQVCRVRCTLGFLCRAVCSCLWPAATATFSGRSGSAMNTSMGS